MEERHSRGSFCKPVRSAAAGNIRGSGWPALFLILLLPLFSGCGAASHELNRPITLRLSADESKLLILNTGNRQVLLSDLEFNNAREIAIPGVDPTEFPLWGLGVTGPSEFALVNRTRGTPGGTKQDADLVQVSQILFFDFSGTRSHRIAWEGRDRPIRFPLQVQGLPGGDLLVIDGDTARISRLRRDGRLLSTFGSFGRNEGEFYFPQDICVLPDGSVLAVDAYNSRLSLFGPDGRFVRTVVGAGEEEGRVMFPQFVCRDRRGNFYCSELETMRVSVFDSAWRFRKALFPQIPASSPRKGRFFQLGGLVYDESHNRLLVADAFHSCIHVFDAAGSWTRAITAVHP